MALGDRAGPDANEGEIATLEAEKAVRHLKRCEL